jgi:hypothetical protein
VGGAGAECGSALACWTLGHARPRWKRSLWPSGWRLNSCVGDRRYVDVEKFLKEKNMGEWSEYFEDFPDENPANYVGNRFDLKLAEALRAQNSICSAEQAKLNSEITRIIERHKKISSKPDKK